MGNPTLSLLRPDSDSPDPEVDPNVVPDGANMAAVSGLIGWNALSSRLEIQCAGKSRCHKRSKVVVLK